MRVAPRKTAEANVLPHRIQITTRVIDRDLRDDVAHPDQLARVQVSHGNDLDVSDRDRLRPGNPTVRRPKHRNVPRTALIARSLPEEHDIDEVAVRQDDDLVPDRKHVRLQAEDRAHRLPTYASVRRPGEQDIAPKRERI